MVDFSGSVDFTSVGGDGSTTCTSKGLGFIVEGVPGATSVLPGTGVSDVPLERSVVSMLNNSSAVLIK